MNTGISNISISFYGLKGAAQGIPGIIALVIIVAILSIGVGAFTVSAFPAAPEAENHQRR